jgi:aminomethyltransferase
MSETIRTAFDAVQRNAGADFTEWEGWFWTNHFGDAAGEHRAVREQVGVWDESPVRKWGFRGRDAMRATDRIFTNDMLGLQVGQVRYAPFCDENGKMVGDGTVFKFAEDHAIAITALDSDLDHFRTVCQGLDVEIEAITPMLPHVQLQGPGALDLLAPLCERDVRSLRYFHFWPDQVGVAGVPCWISRTGYSGELGYEIFCSPEDAERLWAALTSAGARPYGLAAVETLRIESALIFIGYDYFQHQTDPFDMSLDKVIRLDTGDFFGKSALLETVKRPPRRLVTLALEGEQVPEYGAGVTVGGEPTGTLTSPCLSPTLGRVIGLAAVESRRARLGTRCEVSIGDGTAAATVESLPIYDPQKTRPRSSTVVQPA